VNNRRDSDKQSIKPAIATKVTTKIYSGNPLPNPTSTDILNATSPNRNDIFAFKSSNKANKPPIRVLRIRSQVPSEHKNLPKNGIKGIPKNPKTNIERPTQFNQKLLNTQFFFIKFFNLAT
jgi:hypothetical protein